VEKSPQICNNFGWIPSSARETQPTNYAKYTGDSGIPEEAKYNQVARHSTLQTTT